MHARILQTLNDIAQLTNPLEALSVISAVTTVARQ